MGVTYTKEMRQIAKERGWHLCTVKTPGFEIQGPFEEIEFRLIDNAATHVTIVSNGNKKPFDVLKDEQLPNDVAEALEQFKLSIVRHRASKFEDVSRYTLLTVLNALRHFVLVDPKSSATLSERSEHGET